MTVSKLARNARFPRNASDARKRLADNYKRIASELIVESKGH
jgi:hypothetical protein